MHLSSQIITSALQLYFTGELFRNVQKLLKLQCVKITHDAVYKWITKYVNLMETYLARFTPNVSNVWRTDELYLKVKGNTLMDHETRFWIAQQVADTRNIANVQPLFKEAKQIAGKKRNTLISDVAPNFADAINNSRTRHIRHTHIQGDHSNAKMERMYGEMRDREKTMRGLKIQSTAVLPGYQI